MKQLFFILGVLCSFLVNAQTADTPEDDFSRMVSQNKVWQPYLHHTEYPNSWGEQDVAYFFDGFEEKNGKTYSRLVFENDRETTCALLREEDGRVYILLNDDFINRYNLDLSEKQELKDTDFVLYDFNLKEGDVFDTIVSFGMSYSQGGTLYIETRRVLQVYILDVNGHELRAQESIREDDQYITEDCIVEGFGPSNQLDLLFTNYLFEAGTVYTNRLFDIVKDKTTEEVLLSHSSLWNAINNSGVTAPEIGSGVKDGKMYDIMGREVKNPQPGSVYIQNGRKFVAR